jgi:hypothetical protein
MRSKSPLQNPFCWATSTKNRSYSGFYCTLDLEQNAELRILFRCSPIPMFYRQPMQKKHLIGRFSKLGRHRAHHDLSTVRLSVVLVEAVRVFGL